MNDEVVKIVEEILAKAAEIVSDKSMKAFQAAVLVHKSLVNKAATFILEARQEEGKENEERINLVMTEIVYVCLFVETVSILSNEEAEWRERATEEIVAVTMKYLASNLKLN
jgi:hypothetical protein